MTDQADLETLLRSVDHPRSPSPQFRDELALELFGPDWSQSAADRYEDEPPTSTTVPVTRLEDQRRRRSGRGRQRLMLGAGIAAAVVVAVVLASVIGDDGRVDSGPATPGVTVPPTVPPTLDVAAARQACDTFAATAYGSHTKAEVIGPYNARYVTSAADSEFLARGIDAALDRLEVDLAGTGIEMGAVTVQLARAHGIIQQVLDEASPPEDLLGAQVQLRGLEEPLDAIDATLTANGVAGCL